MGLKNIPDFKELCFINKDHAQFFSNFFQAKNSSYNNSTVNSKS